MCGRRAESVHEDRYATGARGDTELTNEAFARIKIDQLLKDAAWRLTDGRSVRYEYPLDDRGRADYVLFDRLGRAVAVLEAKITSVSLTAGEAQGRRYVLPPDGDRFQPVRSRAPKGSARHPSKSGGLPIDIRPAGGGGRLYQTACIDAVFREIPTSRCKLLAGTVYGTIIRSGWKAGFFDG